MKMRDEKCRCGWRFLGFHICVDLSVPCEAEYSLSRAKGKDKKPSNGRTKEHEAALRLANEERWRKHHEKTRERDVAIAKFYRSGATLRDVAHKHQVSLRTVYAVLDRLGVERRSRSLSDKT